MAATLAKWTVLRLNRTVSNRRGIMLLFQRSYSVTGNPQADKALTTLTGGKIEGWLKSYEDFVGLTEVREAQNKVIEAEEVFLFSQGDRRAGQQQMTHVQSKLKELHSQLDKVQRGDERYLALLTEEYEIIKHEKQLLSEIDKFETLERANFALLSSAVRESHEKERQRTERTKYWSVIGSVIGATIGILGTSVNNYLRMREIRGIVNDSAAGGVELKGLVGRLSETMKSQHSHIQSFVNDLKVLTSGGKLGAEAKEIALSEPTDITESSAEQLQKHTTEIMDIIQKQDEAIQNDMADIKKLLGSSKASDIEGNIIYVGPEVQGLLQQTENNIEWKIKTNGLWTVTFIYGAFALTLPVLYAIFKNG